MECYKTSDSIRMLSNQSTEVGADFIAAQVLSNAIEILPEELRRQSLVSAMQSFCFFDVQNTKNFMFHAMKVHPESSLRVGGVFGAHPRIRELIGCKDAPSKYRVCPELEERSK